LLQLASLATLMYSSQLGIVLTLRAAREMVAKPRSFSRYYKAYAHERNPL
jgi:hypothetical protein